MADRVEIALRFFDFVFAKPAGDIGKGEFGQAGHGFSSDEEAAECGPSE
jgi:hypothetical protein